MARVIRYDVGTLQPPRLTPQGYLIVDGYASRVGVQDYRRSDGSTRRELRLPDEVFSPKSLEGFRGAPITDDHPPDHLTPENTRGTAAGAVLSCGKQDGKCVGVTFAVHDAELIKKMQGGKRQLSVGYGVDLDETPGDHPEFGHYDAVQRNIVVNHLAVVDAGRAGPIASARMDSAFAVDADEQPRAPNGQFGSGEGSSNPASKLTPGMRAAGATMYANEMSKAANKAKTPDAHTAAASAHRAAAETHRASGIGSASMIAGHEAKAEKHEKSAGKLRGDSDTTGTDVCTDDANPLDGSGAPVHAQGAMQVQVQPSTGASGAAPVVTLERKDTIVMDELQKKLGEALADAEKHKAKKDAAIARADKADADLKAASDKIAALEGERDNARKDAEAAKSRADKADADLKSRVDGEPAAIKTAADKAREDAEKVVDARVATRVAVMSAANHVLGSRDEKNQPIDRSKMSDREIKIAIVKHVDKVDCDKDAEGKPRADAYIDAMYDGACGRFDAGRVGLAGTRELIANPQLPQLELVRGDASDEQAAAAANKARYRGAWQNTNADALTKAAVLKGGK